MPVLNVDGLFNLAVFQVFKQTPESQSRQTVVNQNLRGSRRSAITIKESTHLVRRMGFIGTFGKPPEPAIFFSKPFSDFSSRLFHLIYGPAKSLVLAARGTCLYQTRAKRQRLAAIISEGHGFLPARVPIG